MTGTMTDAPASSPPPRPRMSAGDKVRLLLRVIGQTLITLGLVVLLFVVYEVWITNIFSDRDNHRIASKLQKEWKTGEDPLLPLPGGGETNIKVGSGIAEIYMPRLGRHYHFAIVEGTSQASLALGPGHYSGTALPGAVGNFAVAGHRVGKGEPFLNIDQLRSDDAVIVETKSAWFVYRVLGRPAGRDPQDVEQSVPIAGDKTVTLPGREIVDPSNGNPLYPVPDNRMTMTTCTPKFTAAQRMIVHASLERSATVEVAATSGSAVLKMPASISALYSSAAN